jgi:hypothetical protein
MPSRSMEVFPCQHKGLDYSSVRYAGSWRNANLAVAEKRAGDAKQRAALAKIRRRCVAVFEAVDATHHSGLTGAPLEAPP